MNSVFWSYDTFEFVQEPVGYVCHEGKEHRLLIGGSIELVKA